MPTLSARLVLSSLALCLALAASARASEPKGPYLPPPNTTTPEEGFKEVSPFKDGATSPPPPVEIQTDGPSAETVIDDSHHPALFWLRAEYVLWFNKKASVPALVTKGLVTDPKPGVLGLGGQILYGNGDVDFNERHGGRFSAGVFLDNEETWAVESAYAFYGNRTVGFTASSLDGSPNTPVLARPFFNVVTGAEDASVVAYPGLVLGSVSVELRNFFQSVEANVTRRLWQSGKNRLEALAGFRYAQLDESLHIQEKGTLTAAAPIFKGNNIVVDDGFDAGNRFYGGQVGLRGELHYRWLVFGGYAKVALGCTSSDVTIAGSTTIDTNPAFVQNAGLLALASNSGSFTRTQFSVMPEAGVNVGVQLARHWQVLAGYSFLYWDHVLRPGDQVDRQLNPRQIPTSNLFGTQGGPLRPAYPERDSSFWVQGFSVGLQFKY